MKNKVTGIILAWLTLAGVAQASTNDITTLVQKGLFEEEANHHLDAAIGYYQDAIETFAKDRLLTATAIFRLGECYRAQGKTNEANVQYLRVLKDFPDQTQLVNLSRSNLPKGMEAAPGSPLPANPSTENIEPLSTEERDEIRGIKDMIQNSPDLVNVRGGASDSALVYVVRHGWLSAAKILVENGAAVNPESPEATTPLAIATLLGNRGMVEYLLSKGANVNALNGRDGRTPLQEAVDNGFKSVAETLLAQGADANLPASDGERALHIAAARGIISLAELLLAHGADVNLSGHRGMTPIFQAIKNNQTAMVSFLISNHANVNLRSEDAETPLTTAVEKTEVHIEIVKSLLGAGAAVNTQMKRGLAVRPSSSAERTVTPLIIKISRGGEPMMKMIDLLFDYAADPNLADETGQSPLDYAIVFGRTNVMADLILHHANLNAPDKQGDPPLAYSSSMGSHGQEAKQMLIAAGADENYLRHRGIFIAQKGKGTIGTEVFHQDSLFLNHHTLFELIANTYSWAESQSGVAFPDFSHVVINRLKPGEKTEEIPVDLAGMLGSADCAKTPALEWGDVVIIPQLDHKINEEWRGLLRGEREALVKCVTRTVTIMIKGKGTNVVLTSPLAKQYAFWMGTGWTGTQRTMGVRPDLQSGWGILGDELAIQPGALYTSDFNSVLRTANVLLISSDLTRVKLKRGGKVTQFNLDLSPVKIQLQDGDVIEVPERDQ